MTDGEKLAVARNALRCINAILTSDKAYAEWDARLICAETLRTLESETAIVRGAGGRFQMKVASL